MELSRRSFLKVTALLGGVAFLVPQLGSSVPVDDPRADRITWFREAKFGMFVHYGMASLSPYGKTRPMPAEVSSEEWERRFTAAKFDAGAIADLAKEAGMGYVTFTPFHGGGPYTFKSKVAHPNTVDDLPAKRDLVGEMAAACRARGLGFMLYIHGSIAQSGDQVYARNMTIFRELLTQYGRIDGLWFDTDSAYYKDKDHKLYPHLNDMFALIRSLQPACLISYCHGVTGDEDFITYEHRYRRQSEFAFVPDDVKRKLAGKPVELCTTMQLDHKDGKGTKMWFNVEGAYHRTADDVWGILGEARRDRCNLLLNIGPVADGSVHPEDVKTLKEVGRRLKTAGFPVGTAGGPTTTEGEDR